MADTLQTEPRRPEVGYYWLLRLRWLSITGQIAICAIFATFFHVILPLGFLAVCIAFTAASNLLASRFRKRLLPHATAICFALILLDTVILTAMLYHTGGAHNPFSALYLLHVTLAAILLPAWAPWLILGLSGLGFWILFSSPHALTRVANDTCCNDMGTHLQGMLLSMVISGAGIAYFVSRLSASLTRQRAELEKVRALSARQEHFASLATLSAGLAHELATPLGTIAVVSADMEKETDATPDTGNHLEDVRLIRSEVARCREILDRIGHEALRTENDLQSLTDLQTLPERLRPYLKNEFFNRIKFDLTAAQVRIPEVPLLQSLAILVKNACEASEPGLPIFVKAETSVNRLCLTVSDRGSGMAPEVVARLGEPFFTTKEPGFGMGLGLFVVRTFVERMRGKLEIDSEPGRGTTIRLVFPSGREGEDDD